ncbi:MAG TPA: site-2 protease family protein [Acidimicrobiales bacterium]|nr:site-2 protease family protein [Acidimicrobiales bacterium]
MNRQQRLVLGGILVLGAIVLVRGGVVSEDTALILAALIPSIILHEVSHGAVALAFGDDTAKQAGRLTLNPVAHVDPFGTLILPAMLAIASGGAAAFGYAKPVPVNPRRMRDPRNHGLLVSLAGPAVNIALALVAAAVFRSLDVNVFDPDRLTLFVYLFGTVNVVLAVFNLLPIPPLDGSAVVERVLPMRYWESYLRFRQYSMGLLLLVVFVFPLDRLFDPAIELWQRLL